MEAAMQFPVVAVMGPRRSKKSTLIRENFPQKPYVNMESTRDIDIATPDPNGFLAQFSYDAVLDEIQKAQRLLSDTQVLVDNSQSKVPMTRQLQRLRRRRLSLSAPTFAQLCIVLVKAPSVGFVIALQTAAVHRVVMKLPGV